LFIIHCAKEYGSTSQKRQRTGALTDFDFQKAERYGQH